MGDVSQDRQALLALVGSKVVAYRVIFARLVGSAAGGLLLGQALYWSERTTDASGWFWKTRQQWTDELGLTRREQEVARKRLRQLGILEERRRGVPAKLYYRVDIDKLISLLAAERVPTSGSEVTNWQVRSDQQAGQKQPTIPESTIEDTEMDGDDTDRTDVLVKFGVSPAVAKKLAATCSTEQVSGWLAYARTATGLQDRVAFVVRRLLDGEQSPEITDRDDRRRYITGELAQYLKY